MKKTTGAIRKIEDAYVNFSEQPAILWFRGVLQSLDVELNPGTLGVKLSLGQALERFIFVQSEVIARKRAGEAINKLNKRLKKIEISYDSLRQHVEEYSKLFIRFYGAVGTQQYMELRETYVNQMVHFFDIRYSQKNNKLLYQQLLFRLTIDHLHVLTFADSYLTQDKGKRHENSKTLRDAIVKKFTEKGLEEPLIYGLIKDLDSMGLFNATQTSLWGGDLHQLYLTDLGRNLLNQLK